MFIIGGQDTRSRRLDRARSLNWSLKAPGLVRRNALNTEAFKWSGVGLYSFKVLRSGCLQIGVDGLDVTLGATSLLAVGGGIQTTVVRTAGNREDAVFIFFSEEEREASGLRSTPFPNLWTFGGALRACMELIESIDNGTFDQRNWALWTYEVLKQFAQDEGELWKRADRLEIRNVDLREAALRRVLSCHEMVRTNFKDSCRPDNLARCLDTSTPALRRQFKAYFGESIHDCVIRFRLDRATSLLGTSESTIDAICRKIGFASTSSFCRLFASKKGMTPTDYRKSLIRLDN